MGKKEAASAAEYAAMVAEAEASVSAVKDPELRRVAFEKILTTLLDGGHSKPQEHKRQRISNRASSNSNKTHKGRATQGPKARVEGLIDEGFFKKQRTIAEVKAELANQGHHIALTSLSGPLQKLTQERRLRRQRIAADGKGSKTTFAYSNW